jgi:hypothetical protein
VLSSKLGLHANHPIAPLVFRLIQGLVGCRDQLRCGHVDSPEHDGSAAANADIGCCGGRCVWNSQLRDRVSCCSEFRAATINSVAGRWWSIRLLAVAVCAVSHIGCRRGQVSEGRGCGVAYFGRIRLAQQLTRHLIDSTQSRDLSSPAFLARGGRAVRSISLELVGGHANRLENLGATLFEPDVMQ